MSLLAVVFCMLSMVSAAFLRYFPGFAGLLPFGCFLLLAVMCCLLSIVFSSGFFLFPGFVHLSICGGFLVPAVISMSRSRDLPVDDVSSKVDWRVSWK
jgi:hypothetical protein